MKSNINSALKIITGMSTVDALERYEKRLDTLYNLGALSDSDLMRADTARIDRIITISNREAKYGIR